MFLNTLNVHWNRFQQDKEGGPHSRTRTPKGPNPVQVTPVKLAPLTQTVGPGRRNSQTNNYKLHDF